MKPIDILKKHTPTILTVIGASGVIATAVMAAKAATKAERLLNKDNGDGVQLSKKDAARLIVPLYIPAAVTGTLTIACIIGSNALNMRQQAALASAYALIDNSYRRYKNAVMEKYGEDMHNDILKTIAAEKAKDTPIYAQTMIECCGLDFGDKEEEKLFYDCFSDRYFQSTVSRVLQAEYHLNRNFVIGGCVTLNDFYEFLGIEKTDEGKILGWSMGDGEIVWIDFNHDKTVTDDGLEVYLIDMVFAPSGDFYPGD